MRRWSFVLLLLLGYWLSTNALFAQPSLPSDSPAYARYDAPGRLAHIVVADVNHNGIDDFVVVAENVNVRLVGADGREQWPAAYQTQDPVLHITTINIDGPEHPRREILLGTSKQIILLSSTGEELWQQPVPAPIATVAGFDHNNDGRDEILVALANGLLQLFNPHGQLLWHYPANTGDLPDNAFTKIEVGDVDRNGRNDIVLAYLNARRFSQLALIDGDGQLKWDREQPVDGRIMGLTLVAFEPQAPLSIGVSTRLSPNRHHLLLYDAQGHKRWFRTPNKPITAISAAILAEGTPALLVGTSVGTIIAYDRHGRPYWREAYASEPNRRIVAISPSPAAAEGNQLVSLAVILGREPNSADPNDVLLLSDDGHLLQEHRAADTDGLTRLVDVNRDGKHELLLANFATLELLDPGIGVSEYAEAWLYRLGAQPLSVLKADIDRAGRDEILVGTNDGRIHLLHADGSASLLADDLGGVVTELALARRADGPPEIVVVHNNRIVGVDGVETFEGWLKVLRPDGRVVWSRKVATTITSLLVDDINSNGRPEVIVGTTDSQVIAYSLDGIEYWKTAVNGSVNHLLLITSDRGTEIVVGSRANEIIRFNNKGTGLTPAAAYGLQEINSLQRIEQQGELATQMMVAIDDGTMHGLAWRGIELWSQTLEGVPTISHPADNSFIIVTDEAKLYRLDYDGNFLWPAAGLDPAMDHITNLYWGDLDDDGRPDLAVGNREGRVQLFTSDGEPWGSLDLRSGVFYMTSVRSGPDRQTDLVIVTNNGVVQLFRRQANRPPLLIDPVTEVLPGRYGINVSVIDVEEDPVRVTLEVYDPELREWVSQGEKVADKGNNTLPWLVDPKGAGPVYYRFLYDDGSHRGVVMPVAGPPPVLHNPLLTSSTAIAAVLFLGTLTGVFLMRQVKSPAAHVRRFYAKIKQQSAATLQLLEDEYNRTAGSPDFLLSLANKARQDSNRPLASLADGLFLLAARPDAALPIINSALDEAAKLEPPWQTLDAWQLTYRTAQAVLEAPTVMELTLLRPQFTQLLDGENAAGRSSPVLNDLLPVLSSLRDSQRVDMAEDRLVYLNEAAILLGKHKKRQQDEPVQTRSVLASAIVNRWLGLVNAEIEELRGRAQLVLNLKTKRLAPEVETVIALEVHNRGRAPAEHIRVTVEENAAYRVCSRGLPQLIPYLPSGRTRQVTFNIEPHVDDRFRIAFKLTYDDRHCREKEVAFADMVHMLPPVRDFTPIANPYAPGTPLRRNSAVFFGREDLFEFIRQNASNRSQPNVLILVGQRRTGKTSALLQLEEHLSDTLLPVYIDCQSLGVVPGMPALFHDLAWIIADTLNARGYELAVPEPAAWQQNPSGRFQRQFIPAARALLPADTTLLLVFDEFEAFENLVKDGILPPTLFTYLRHLMQHGNGLSFVFVGTRRLEEMTIDYWSVLFNIALYRHIGYLNRAPATRLICNPVAPHLVYDDLAIDKIWRVTAGHPYFLQLVCYTLVNRANTRRTSYVTVSDVNAALEEMLRLGEVHFAYLWQRSSHTERALLTALAHLMDRDGPFHPADLVQYLADYGIDLNPARVTAGLQQLVQREIMSEITDEGTTLYELRIGLVGLWVAQNKSLSALYEGKKVHEPVRMM